MGVTVDTVDTVNTVKTSNHHTEPERIEGARRAARCAHLRYNGDACGCPALRGKPFCRFHVEGEAPDKLALPLLEDAAALQVAIMRIVRALELDMIEPKKATAQLYALQLAGANLARLGAELPVDPGAAKEDLVMRLMRILDPPLEKYALVFQEVDKIVALL